MEEAAAENERCSSRFADLLSHLFSAADLICDPSVLACREGVTGGTSRARASAVVESDFERARIEVALASAMDGSEFVLGRARDEERSEDDIAGGRC